MNSSNLSRKESEAIEDLPRTIRLSIRFLDPDSIRLGCQKYFSGNSATDAVVSHLGLTTDAVSITASTTQLQSASTARCPDISAPPYVTADPAMSRTLRSDCSTYESHD